MANNDFNSALALFQSLYKSHKGDIFTIVERFILVGVRISHLSSVTIERISQLLKDQFNLDIPRTIIIRCVNNQQTFKYKGGEYIVVSEPSEEIDNLIEELNAIDNKNDNIITELYSFIEHNNLVNLSKEERDQIREIFFDYVKDREIESSNKYFLDITQFIICHEEDKEFLESLDSIKEGTIIYHGIRYSETSDAKTWKDNITFFLDMEYLFSSFGLNGTFYKECFFDFYKLVKEINDGSPSKMGQPRIRLMYFPKTKDNIDKFFNVACRIKEGDESLYNNTEAMEQIINHCSDSADVIKYKNEFYGYLNSLGIIEFSEEIDLEKHCDWLFETKELDEKIGSEFEEEDHADIYEYLLFADYINILREGRNASKLESCRYIFLSASSLANRFSKFLKNNDSDAKTPVICRMDLFTENMWFKLRKGIVDESTIASFQVLFKAKSIVSSFLSESVVKNYKTIKESDDDPSVLKGYYAELRSKRHTPENVNAQNAQRDLAFLLEENSLDKYKEEQAALRHRAKMADIAEKELEESKRSYENLKSEFTDLKKQLHSKNFEVLLKSRKKAKRKFCLENTLYKYSKIIIWSIIVMLILVSLYFEKDNIKSPFGIVSGLCSIIGVIINLPQKTYNYLMKFRKQRYKKYIMNELW